MHRGSRTTSTEHTGDRHNITAQRHSGTAAAAAAARPLIDVGFFFFLTLDARCFCGVLLADVCLFFTRKLARNFVYMFT